MERATTHLSQAPRLGPGVLSKAPIIRIAPAASLSTLHELPASPPIRASPYHHKVGSLTDYHLKVAGHNAELF